MYWSCNAETISCCLGTQSVVAGVCTHQRKLWPQTEEIEALGLLAAVVVSEGGWQSLQVIDHLIVRTLRQSEPGLEAGERVKVLTPRTDQASGASASAGNAEPISTKPSWA